jgi:hypothetical protein
MAEVGAIVAKLAPVFAKLALVVAVITRAIGQCRPGEENASQPGEQNLAHFDFPSSPGIGRASKVAKAG